MTDPDVSPTEAVLAMAAATTRDELITARLALIRTGARMLDPLDRSAMVAGDGTAGRALLGGAATSRWAADPSCARRSQRLLTSIPAAHPGPPVDQLGAST